MASLVPRGHPKAAMLAGAATCIICLPILLPVFLLFSPFLLLLSSLFSMGLLRTLLTSLLRMMCLSFDLPPPRRITSNKRRLGMENEGKESYGRFEGGQIREEEGSLRQSRVHEYLEDQLKNLNVVAFGRTESGEDLLPCSFSFGSDDCLESLNMTLPCHGEG